jgi:hypothetical protein
MFESYVYKVKSKITGQYYFGSRCKNVRLSRSPENDFWVRYTTSSKRVNELIRQFGKESFEIQILLKSENYSNCYDLEQELIEKHLSDPLCLNLYCRKTNRFSTFGKTHSEETKSKISAKCKNRMVSDETKKKISNSTRGKKKTPEQIEAAAAGRRGKKNKVAPWNKGLVGVQVAWNKGKPWPTKQCPHCSKSMSLTNYKRWHGDNCKLFSNTISSAQS